MCAEVSKNPHPAFHHSPNQPPGNAPSGAHCFIGLHTSSSGFSVNSSVVHSNLTAPGRAGLCGETSNSCWLPVCFSQVAGCCFFTVGHGEVNVTHYSSSLVLQCSWRRFHALIISAMKKLRCSGGVFTSSTPGMREAGRVMLIWKELGPLGGVGRTQRQIGFLEVTPEYCWSLHWPHPACDICN